MALTLRLVVRSELTQFTLVSEMVSTVLESKIQDWAHSGGAGRVERMGRVGWSGWGAFRWSDGLVGSIIRFEFGLLVQFLVLITRFRSQL